MDLIPTTIASGAIPTRARASRPSGPAAKSLTRPSRGSTSTTSRFFLWVHLYDPHAPYEPPAEYSREGGRATPTTARSPTRMPRSLASSSRCGQRGVLASTVIVVTGDHGEGLGDHGEHTHGMLAYDSTLRVPLVVSGAAVPKRVVTAPVSLADLAPTLSRRGWPCRPPGRAPICSRRQLAERDVYAETQYPRAAGWHALVGARRGALEADSVVRDRALRPLERSRRAEERRGGARRGRARHDGAPDGASGGCHRRPPRRCRPKRASDCGRSATSAAPRRRPASTDARRIPLGD